MITDIADIKHNAKVANSSGNSCSKISIPMDVCREESNCDINDAIRKSTVAVAHKTKVVRKKRSQKSNLHSFIQFDVVPSPHCIPQGSSNEIDEEDVDDQYNDQSYDRVMEDDCPVTIGNMKKGGKTIRSTGFNKKPKVQKNYQLVRVHDESKQGRRAEQLKENYARQKSNIEAVLLKNSIKRFGYDIYTRRSDNAAAMGTRGNINRSPYYHHAADDIPAVKKHELKRNNIPKEQAFLSQLIDLQHRELTPEDYELLLLLDNTVACKTVDPELLKSINEVSAVLAQLLGEICSICMEGYEAEQKTRTLHCKHHFHSHCIDQWLSHSSLKCPLDGLPAFPTL